MFAKDFGITVEQLLAQGGLTRARLLAGKGGLSRVVTSVGRANPNDLSSAAASGTFFLVDGPAHMDESEMIFKALHNLSEASTAGLGLQGSIAPLSRELLALADDLRLPIVNMGDETTVSVVENQVLTTVLENQAQLLNKIQDLNRALTSTMLHGGNLQEICKILYQRFGNSVAISSDHLSSYVLNTTEEKRSDICAVLEEEKRRSFLGQQIIPNELVREADMLGNRKYTRIIIPIFSDSMLLGRIYMWEDVNAVSGVEISVLESVTSLIALDMMKKMSILNIENSNRGGFLRELLAGDRKLFQKAQMNAKHYDMNLNSAHQVMVISVKSQKNQQDMGRKSFFQFNTNLISILQQTVPNTIVKTIYANQGHQIIVLMETTPSGGEYREQPLTDFLNDLVQCFDRDGLADTITIGIGREYKNPAELYKSLNEAKRALLYPNNATITFFKDIGVYRILSYEGVQTEAELFCDEVLRPAIAYDQERDGFLICTLKAYFQFGGNLTKIAKFLNVHYNTVSNRLQKLQELLALRLDDADLALDIQIALKIYEMKKDDISGR